MQLWQTLSLLQSYLNATKHIIKYCCALENTDFLINLQKCCISQKLRYVCSHKAEKILAFGRFGSLLKTELTVCHH